MIHSCQRWQQDSRDGSVDVGVVVAISVGSTGGEVKSALKTCGVHSLGENCGADLDLELTRHH